MTLMTAWAALTAGGCAGPLPPQSAQTSGDAAVEQAIASLKNGDLIKRLNRQRTMTEGSLNLEQGEGSGERAGEALSQRGEEGGGAGIEAGTTSVSVTPASGPATDPCPGVGNPAAGASEQEWKDELAKLGACMNQIMEPARRLRAALTYETTFFRSVIEKPLSKMPDEELKQFLRTEFVSSPASLAGLSDDEAPRRRLLRNRFEDRELDELQRLADKITRALSATESKFFEVVDAHRSLVEHFAVDNSRYQLLLTLRNCARFGLGAMAVAEQVSQVLALHHMERPIELSKFPVSMLRPWAIVGILPDPGREADPLHEPVENPFVVAERAMANFGGPPGLVSAQRHAYVAARQSDNPPMPVHAPPAADAVRVAIVDTGVDFVAQPELGVFLSNGANGAMDSFDFQDNDYNPYLSSQGVGWHGSATSATVLTILAHYVSDMLRDRKLDLSVWKIDTVRALLAEPYGHFNNWQSREAMAEALIRVATDDSIRIKPQIVSVSEIFALQPILKNANKLDAVLKAPWLWVMAAGNQGVLADKDRVPVCLSDVPAQNRVDSHILCVGALRRGTLQDKIARYSNYGTRVDLYAYQSYSDLCTGGTSCSTPAITSAAAAVAASFPSFGPAELKEVLLRASREKELEVDQGTGVEAESQLIEVPFPGGSFFKVLDEVPLWTRPPQGNGSEQLQVPMLRERRVVRVLDPSTMMDQIMEAAENLAAEKKRAG